MKLETMINDVLPEGSIFYKHNHGLFSFYMDDRSFEDGRDFLQQKISESFTEFIRRIIEKTIKDEENDSEPLVSIDFAINGGIITGTNN